MKRVRIFFSITMEGDVPDEQASDPALEATKRGIALMAQGLTQVFPAPPGAEVKVQVGAERVE